MADTVYHSHTHTEEKSIGDLFSDLSDEIKSLVTNEIKLAKIEMKHKGTVVGKNSAFVVVGLTLLYAGFLGLMATAALALGLIISLWLAALIVSIVILIIGAAMAIKGVNTLKRMKMTPELAIESMEGEN
ncbi:MAG: phage holin family protein [Desulfococcaceae bacterium]